MRLLQDIRYRCEQCGEPLLRDGGNRHIPGQVSSLWMCIHNGCVNNSIRMRIPIVYVDVPTA